MFVGQSMTPERTDRMHSQRRVHSRAATNIALFSALWLFLPVVQAQTSEDKPAPQPKVTALQSDACPVVHAGEMVSFEFDPVFDPIWPVTGLRMVSLDFARLAEDGVTLERPSVFAGTRNSAARISSIGNGFFHVQALIGRAAPGEYHLVNVHAFAAVVPEYRGRRPEPEMTVSPAGERYCITIVGTQASRLPQLGD
jgi:hypothetical protein